MVTTRAGRDTRGRFESGRTSTKVGKTASYKIPKKKKAAPNPHCGRGRAGIKGKGQGRPGKTCLNH